MSSLPNFITSLRLDFSQRQWKSRVYLTFSLHFSPTRLFTTAVEKSSLPHFHTSLLSDSTFHNGSGKVESTSLSHFNSLRLDFSQRSGKVESTSLSHFTSLRLDFSQRQWKSRVYLTFSLQFSPTRLFTTAVETSSLPHFLTSLLSDSTFHNGSGKVEST